MMLTRREFSYTGKRALRTTNSLLLALSIVVGWMSVLPAQAQGQATALSTVTQAASRFTPGFNTPCQVSGKTQNCAEIHAFQQIGNRMFIGGKFQQVLGPTGNLLIDPATGKPLAGLNNLTVVDTSNNYAVDTSFKHVFNGAILALAASPDGSRLYVGGQFTSVDGKTVNHLAAFDLRNAGAPLVAAFTVNGVPSVDPGIKNAAHSNRASVRSLLVGASTNGGTAGTLYVGGDFVTAFGAAAQQLIAIDLGTGSPSAMFTPNLAVGTTLPNCGNLTTPVNDSNNWVQVWSLALGADGNGDPLLYVAGHFDTVDSNPQTALAAIDPSTGRWISIFAPDLDYEKSVSGTPCYDPLHAVNQVVPVAATADRSAGVLVGQAGHYNRAYRLGLSGSRTWMEQPGGDVQSIAIAAQTVYIGGHFICWSTDPSQPLNRASCVAGLSTAALPPPYEIQRVHLAAVDYQSGATDMSWAPMTEPATNAPYYNGVWTLLMDSSGALWTGGVSRSVTTPDGLNDPHRMKLAVFPLVAAGSPPTGTFTPTGCVVHTTCTFAAWGAPARPARISSYQWDFGDGTISGPEASSSIGHTFATTGSFRMIVTFTDSTGAHGLAEAMVNVIN